MTGPGGRVELAPGRCLHVTSCGEGIPLLMLHGFTGCSESLEPTARDLGPGFRTIRVDLLGHGRSDAPRDPAAYRMECCARDLCAVLDRLELPAAHVLGYSMGGRLALGLAALHPERVRSLLLVGARAGIADPQERRARVRADEALAERILRGGICRFVDEWMALPLFASQRRLGREALGQAREQRLRCRPEGLAGCLRGMGAGAQPPLHGVLARIAVPALLVAGAEDPRFAAIARELAAQLPRGRVALIPDAGHAAHLENPRAFAALARRFLQQAAEPERKGEPMSRPPQPSAPLQRAHRPDWKLAREYRDIRYEKADGMARIAICRPEVRNAFRPRTLFELIDAFADAREDSAVGVILFTGEGGEAFCSGGDQRVRGDAGYVGEDGVPRLNALDLQRVLRSLPKPVIALVAGYAIGGGHVLHLLCDLTIAADNARFGQTGPRVGSFDGGFGAAFLARVVGQKKAREIWYLCDQYGAEEAREMGLVNAVVPVEELEDTGVAWAQRILRHSPMAIRCLKAAFNADCDGQAGLQELAGHATQLFYMTEEAKEGRDAFVEKREPDFSRFPWRP